MDRFSRDIGEFPVLQKQICLRISATFSHWLTNVSMDFRHKSGVHVSYTPHNLSCTRCILVTDTLFFALHLWKHFISAWYLIDSLVRYRILDSKSLSLRTLKELDQLSSRIQLLMRSLVWIWLGFLKNITFSPLPSLILSYSPSLHSPSLLPLSLLGCTQPSVCRNVLKMCLAVSAVNFLNLKTMLSFEPSESFHIICLICFSLFFPLELEFYNSLSGLIL